MGREATLIDIGVTINQDNRDWKGMFDNLGDQLSLIAVGAVDSVFYDLLLRATPVDMFTKKGKAKGFGEHIQDVWEHEIDPAGRGVMFKNPFIYGPILDRGGYRGIGPRTVPGPGAGIYSKQAKQGIIQRFLKNPEILDKAVRMVAAKIRDRVSGLVIK